MEDVVMLTATVGQSEMKDAPEMMAVSEMVGVQEMTETTGLS